MAMEWIKRLFSARSAPRAHAGKQRFQPESPYVVTVDEQHVVCQPPNGEAETIAWADLDAMIIETNDTGPWGIDVWWLLLDAKGEIGCAIPQGTTGDRELLEALQALPGFDSQNFISAMACTDNQRFICWRRKPTDLD